MNMFGSINRGLPVRVKGLNWPWQILLFLYQTLLFFSFAIYDFFPQALHIINATQKATYLTLTKLDTHAKQ